MSMRAFSAPPRALLVAYLVVVGSAFATAHADPPAPPAVAALLVESSGTPLTLREAVQSALRSNPVLMTFAYSLRAQDARIGQAGLRPAPELAGDLENVLGTGETRGLDAAEATFALSQVIELGDKRARRIAVAQLGREAITIEQQAAQLDVLAELTRRFIRVAGDQQGVVLARDARDLASKTVDAVKRRVEAGKSPDVELLRANVELTRSEIELRQTESERLVSRRKLAAMWGDSEAEFGPVQADLYQLPAPVQFQMLLARLQSNPDFTRFATAARLRDAEIRLAEARRSPDVELSGGVRRLQETQDQAFVLGFSVPLFPSRQAAPGTAEAQALRAQVEAERDAAFVAAQAQLFELYQALRLAIDETEGLRRDVLPQIQQALQQSEYAFDRGRYSYLELADAQRAYLDVQRALIEAAVNAQTLQAELERLTGEPLSSDSIGANP